MERELWRRVTRALGRLPRWRPRGAVYDNRQILAVLLWPTLHDRGISWACRRENWPMQAWRRALPDQSTLSRRLRDTRLLEDLRGLVRILQRPLGPAVMTLILDGKPLEVSNVSADPDAASGWAAGRYGRGYKLHTLIDAAGRLLGFALHPMNHAESVAARELLDQAAAAGLLPAGARVLADSAYDSNPLYAAAAGHRLRLIAPRRKPGVSVSTSHRQHPDRLAAIRLTEFDPVQAAKLRLERAAIERYFGALASVGGGLIALPAWARRLHRVRAWVAAKLVLNTARHVRRTTLAA